MCPEANAPNDRFQLEATVWVHPTAAIIGKVQSVPGVSVGPHAVAGAVEPVPNGTVAPIVIGRYTVEETRSNSHRSGRTRKR